MEMTTTLTGSLAFSIFFKIVLILLMYLSIAEILPLIMRRLVLKVLKETQRQRLMVVFDVFGAGCFIAFLLLLYPKIDWTASTNALLIIGIALSVPIGLFFLMDRGIDPILERIFTKSSEHYNRTIQAMNGFQTRLIVKACILAPILEELMARGVIQGQILGQLDPLIAIGIASVLFAVIHVNLIQVFSALLPSLVLGCLYDTMDNLILCMFIHMCYNALNLIQLKSKWHNKISESDGVV